MLKRILASSFALCALAACGGGGGGGSTGSTVPTPAPSVSSTPAAIAFNDYPTFGYDNRRDVYNPNTTAIKPASLSQLHLGWQAAIGNGNDYDTQTQPVLATEIPGHAGVLFVGGSGLGGVYGYDAISGKLLWRASLGVEKFLCNGTTLANLGVGGTAAYDPATRSLYIVGNANAQAEAPATSSLFRINGATGAITGSANFTPSVVGPSELNFAHTSVALAPNGIAYVGTGSTCDISSWRGRVAAINTGSMTLAANFFTVWNGTTQPWGGGGVWGWGGVALDSAGNVWTGVGNADTGVSNGSIVAPFVAAPTEYSGYAETLLALSPSLGYLTSQHPIPTTTYNGATNATDLDVTGTPVLFTPAGAGCDTLAALQAKSGVLYVYDTAKVASGPIASYQLAPASFGDAFIDAPAYSPATNLLYAPAPIGAGTLYPPGMVAINPGCGAPSVAWHTSFGPDSNLNGGSIARSVPAVTAGGVVFVGTPCEVTPASTCTGSVTPAGVQTAKPQGARRVPACCASPSSNVGGALWALDAGTGAVLNGGNPIITTPGVLRMPPTIDGNWVFVVDNNGNMYGLTIDPSIKPASAIMRAADGRSTQRWHELPAHT
jgi:hypothetical protein